MLWLEMSESSMCIHVANNMQRERERETENVYPNHSKKEHTEREELKTAYTNPAPDCSKAALPAADDGTPAAA